MRYYVGNFFYGEDFWHYGVKGQKKGVRRYQNPDGSLKPEGYRHYGRNPNPKKRGFKVLKNSKKLIKRAKYKEMTDEQLKTRINRMKLENEYLTAKKNQKQLTRREKKQMSEGKKHVISCLKDLGMTYIKEKISGETKKALKRIEKGLPE